MKYILPILLMISSVSIFGIRIYKGIILEQNVEGFIKRAADANTVELARSELNKVVSHLEQNKITKGYTSVFYKTPNEDIGFWYTNLKASLDELAGMESASALEKTNGLMKLRETLMDHGGEGREKVTVPKGLSVFPLNGLWAILMTYAFVALLASIIIIAIQAEKNKKEHTDS